MAGDWIKMRTNLRRHPKVVRISSALSADRLRVVGGLQAVWSLFDEHSEDGQLDGYNPAAVDDEIGWPGFCSQLIAVKWLQFDGISVLSLPDFDTHNGASAKRRAQETDRKRAERNAAKAEQQADDSMSASDADKKRTREEKRREEKSYSVAKATGGKPPAEKPPADPVKQEIWDAGRSILAASRMPPKQIGTFLGKLVSDYTAPVVLDAVRCAVKEQPADAAEYLKGTCMRLKGERPFLNRQEALEQRNQATALDWAQGAPDAAR